MGLVHAWEMGGTGRQSLDHSTKHGPQAVSAQGCRVLVALVCSGFPQQSQRWGLSGRQGLAPRPHSSNSSHM